MLASTAQKTISMFDLRTGQITQHYEAHHDSVNSFAVHPEGTHMVSVSSNSEIKVIRDLPRSGISSKELWPTICTDTQETSRQPLFQPKETSLELEEQMALC